MEGQRLTLVDITSEATSCELHVLGRHLLFFMISAFRDAVFKGAPPGLSSSVLTWWVTAFTASAGEKRCFLLEIHFPVWHVTF